MWKSVKGRRIIKYLCIKMIAYPQMIKDDLSAVLCNYTKIFVKIGRTLRDVIRILPFRHTCSRSRYIITDPHEIVNRRKTFAHCLNLLRFHY